MSTPQVSIIVPVYNVEKYLRRCVDSILAQKFLDFEVLLIDDGSTDKSGEICEDYVQKDSRIRVFRKTNGGVSSARNLALDNKKGEWVVFVDSDDYISDNHIHDLLQATNSNKEIDVVIDYATRIYNNRTEKEKYQERTLTISDVKVLFSEDDLIWHTSPWGKLYKSEIIDKYEIRFPKGMHIGEDACFLFSYLIRCRCVRTICNCGYNYMIENEKTLTKRINSFESELFGLQNIQKSISSLHQVVGDFINHGCFAWLIASYQRRCLIALYRSNKSFRYRYSFISSIDFNCYLHNLKEDSYQGKIYQFLLSKRLYLFYDIIRRLISIVKS